MSCGGAGGRLFGKPAAQGRAVRTVRAHHILQRKTGKVWNMTKRETEYEDYDSGKVRRSGRTADRGETRGMPDRGETGRTPDRGGRTVRTSAKNSVRRRRRRKRRIRRLCWTAAFLLTMIMAFLAVGKLASDFLGEDGLLSPESVRVFREEGESAEEDAPVYPELSHLYSTHAALADGGTGEILSEYRGDEKVYPASLTKIMTALLTVEHVESLDVSVTVPEEIFPALYAEDASMAGFLPGETVSARDLLYGILLPSGAECCKALAVYISGSEEAFVGLMNQRAEELGLTRTHFCNSSGLHDEDHYSTAEDLCALLACALKDEDFRAAFTTRRYSTPPSNRHPDGITFYSTMFQAMEREEVKGGKILGGKTGYTQEAGLCLASLAEVGGKEYILVTAGAEGSHDTQPFHILDALGVYDQIGEM